MVKKVLGKGKRSATGDVSLEPTQISMKSPTPNFPSIGLKSQLDCRILEADQIIVIPVRCYLLPLPLSWHADAHLQDIFIAEECKQFVKFIEGLPLELTPPPKRGEALRVNCR